MKAKARILLLAAMMFLGASLTGQAASFKLGEADFNLGGTICFDVGYKISDLGDRIVSDGSNYYYGPEKSQTDFYAENPGTTRVNLMANYGRVTGFVEFGLDPNVYKRHAYLSCDLGQGNSILVGHTYSLFALHFNEQRQNYDQALFGFGNIYAGRNPQVRFTHQGEKVTLALAFEDNDSASRDKAPFFALDGWYSQNQLTPKIVANLSYKNDQLWVSPSVVWQSVELKGNTYFNNSIIRIRDLEVDSYALALDGGFTFAALGNLGFEYEAWYGQNTYVIADMHDMRPYMRFFPFGLPVLNLYSYGIDDVSSFGGWAQFAIPLESVTIFIGAGYQQADIEVPANMKPYFEEQTSTRAAFVSARYNITGQFYVQPELAVFDYGDDSFKQPGQNLGSDIFAGVHFEYDF